MSKITNGTIEMLRASGHFDESWYLERYPDVAMLGMDPVKHYLWVGARLGRDPSLEFSTRGYFALNPDVAEIGMNPLVHYALQGKGEGRRVQSASDGTRWVPSRTDYVERHSFKPLAARPARVVAMYLPQFHAIPENDEWWGKGFTEWSNVRAAQPQFIGQYQPHEPHDDIGYYDLSSTSVMLKQIELANTYGIEGFCFYYYWFNGRRLLEKPVNNYLNNANLDLPFCLCWANENWSRRWDGLDSEILMAQAHSPDDDLRVIADLGRYIRDDRYIRIGGKPLVLVYRPSLLPSPRDTAQRWRQWCRANGIGEIYLAYTQSFENTDPADYGFDAAIEFPPNNSSPPDLTQRVVPTTENYAGKVYDWTVLVERCNHYVDPGYKLFRSVCPGWDNTARRKAGGTTFVGNTPALYQQWLENAVADTVRRFQEPDERIVFVNAWNEWAEGAHLEPDKRTGYAYLEATREAFQMRRPSSRVALVIHAFYPEVLSEILAFAGHLPLHMKLFVSTVPEKEEEVRALLMTQPRRFRLFVNENRGRDVLPFLRVLAALVEEKIDFAAKVHTKRSPHRSDGEQWRNELYRSVIGQESFRKSVEALEDDSTLGMLGPKGHLVSMDTYLGSNRARLLPLARQLGLDTDKILDYSFFAGTMFIARVTALKPLLCLNLCENDFEPEAGQIDGTLAHVIERLITLCVQSGNYRLGFTVDPAADAVVNNHYGFA